MGEAPSSAIMFLDTHAVSHVWQEELEELCPHAWVAEVDNRCSQAKAATAGELEVLLDFVRKGTRRVAAHCYKEARLAFKQWVAKALERGASQAHKFTKGAVSNTTPHTAEVKDGRVHASPGDLLDMHVGKFGTLWTRKADERSLNHSQVISLIHAARQQEATLCTEKQLEIGIQKGVNGSGRGVDMIETILLKKSPLRPSRIC